MAGQELLSVTVGEQGGTLQEQVVPWQRGRAAQGRLEEARQEQGWVPTTGCDAGGATADGPAPTRTLHAQPRYLAPSEPPAKGVLRQTGACMWWGGKNYSSLRRR